MVYYAPNLALGLLVDRFVDDDGDAFWNYILRSPRRTNLNHHIVSTQRVQESKIIAAIENGRFQHYYTKNEQTT